MNTLKTFFFAPAAFAATATLTLAAHAGRPLAVDDANVNDQGAGHVEAWVARDASRSTVLNLAPAYAQMDGLEISGVLSRDNANRAVWSSHAAHQSAPAGRQRVAP